MIIDGLFNKVISCDLCSSAPDCAKIIEEVSMWHFCSLNVHLLLQWYSILLIILILQLLSHPFIKKYENSGVDLREYVRSVFDPTQKLKEIADVSSLICFTIMFLVFLIVVFMLDVKHVDNGIVLSASTSAWLPSHDARACYMPELCLGF